ncbi:hypothetical protein [Oryzifoliimicrobium ureilyticus]|uniref:hypothetical protein n=1 Tax=Oryzifoliimicrobium ureilyticus TaxID=3113724 RepID=UPI0030761327
MAEKSRRLSLEEVAKHYLNMKVNAPASDLDAEVGAANGPNSPLSQDYYFAGEPDEADDDASGVKYVRVMYGKPPEDSADGSGALPNGDALKGDRLPVAAQGSDTPQRADLPTAAQLAAAKSRLEWDGSSDLELDPYGSEGIKPATDPERSSPYVVEKASEAASPAIRPKYLNGPTIENAQRLALSRAAQPQYLSGPTIENARILAANKTPEVATGQDDEPGYWGMARRAVRNATDRASDAVESLRSGANAFRASAVDGVPVAGPYLRSGINGISAGIQYLGDDKSYWEKYQEIKAREEADIEANPKAALIGSIAPSVVGAVVAPEIGVPNLAYRLAGGAVIGGVDGLVRSGGDWNAAGKGALTGGGIALAGPLVGKAIGPVVEAVGKAVTPVIGNTAAKVGAKSATSMATGGLVGGTGAAIGSGGDPEAIRNGIYAGLLTGVAAHAAVGGAKRLMGGPLPALSERVNQQAENRILSEKTSPKEFFHARETGRETDWPPLEQSPNEGIFDKDATETYSKNAPARPDGKIAIDDRGNPIVARHIFGVQRPGEINTGQTADQVEKIIRDMSGSDAIFAPLGQDISGKVVTGKGKTAVYLNERLHEADVPKVGLHEAGHLVEHKFGKLDIPEEARGDLEQNYQRTLSKSAESKLFARYPTPNPILPKDVNARYEDPAKGDSELIAQGIASYGLYPNWFKENFPQAVEFFKSLNGHPAIKDLLHFNSLAATLTGGAAAIAVADREKQ